MTLTRRLAAVICTAALTLALYSGEAGAAVADQHRTAHSAPAEQVTPLGGCPGVLCGHVINDSPWTLRAASFDKSGPSYCNWGTGSGRCTTRVVNPYDATPFTWDADGFTVIYYGWFYVSNHGRAAKRFTGGTYYKIRDDESATCYERGWGAPYCEISYSI
jgi:hypothetical protein